MKLQRAIDILNDWLNDETNCPSYRTTSASRHAYVIALHNLITTFNATRAAFEYVDTLETDRPPIVEITADDYRKLYEDALMYRALAAAGVDNWSGYNDDDGMLSRVEQQVTREMIRRGIEHEMDNDDNEY